MVKLAQDQATDIKALEAQIVKLEADKALLTLEVQSKVIEVEAVRNEMAKIPKPAGWQVDRATAKIGESCD